MTIEKDSREPFDPETIAVAPPEVIRGELADLLDAVPGGEGTDEPGLDRATAPGMPRLLGRRLLAGGRRRARVARRFACSLCGLLAAVAVGAAGVLFVVTLPSSVTAQGAFALRPQPTAPVAADTVTLLAQEYLSYATSPAVIARNAGPLGIAPRAARESVTGSVGNGTAVVELEVNLANASDAVALDSRILRAAVSRARNDKLLDADIVVEPTAAAVRHNPPRLLLLAADTLAALTVWGLVWYVLRGRRRTRLATGIGHGPGGAAYLGHAEPSVTNPNRK